MTGLPQTFSENEDITYSLADSSNQHSSGTLRRSSTIVSGSEKDKSTDPDSKKLYCRRLSNVSAATLTNVSTPSKGRAKSDPVQ